MAPGPDWELWRHIESAKLWQFVALLAGVDPDSITRRWNRSDDKIEWEGANDSFHRLLRIAVSSVAHNLACRSYGRDAENNPVLMSEFLRWAQSKGFPIPPELRPPEGTVGLPRFGGHWGYAANLPGRAARSYSSGLK